MTLRKLTLIAAMLAGSVSVMAASTMPPAVNDKQGIGYERGWLGHNDSTDFAWNGSFQALDERPSRSVQVDLPRLLKLNGDSDVYAYWLATHHAFAELVEAFADLVRAGEIKAPSAGQIKTAIDPTGDPHNEENKRVNWMGGACSAEVFARAQRERSGTVLSQTYPCERYERIYRETLLNEDPVRALAMLGKTLARQSPPPLSEAPSISFTKGKRRIGAAYLIVSQAAYVATTGQTNESSDSQIRMLTLRAAGVVAEAAKAADGSVLDKLIHLTNPGGEGNGLTTREEVAVFVNAVGEGRRLLAKQVKEHLQ